MAELSELDFYKLQYTGQQVDTALGQILNGEVQQAVEDAQAAAEEAQAAQAAVENLGVAADSLPSTALARVTKTVGPDGAVTLTFGIPRGDTGPVGPAGPQGDPGVAVATDGLWALHIDSEGHLILDYDGDTPPDLEIDENGHLIYTVNGQTVDLGQVTGGGSGGGDGVSSIANLQGDVSLEAEGFAEVSASGSTITIRAEIPFGQSTSSASSTAKTVSIAGFTLKTGAVICVEFTNTNTTSTPTLNVSSTGVKYIRVGNSAPSSGQLRAGVQHLFRYDGTYWQLLNPYVEAGGGGTAGVSSFGGRTGAVVPQSGDYTAEMVGAVPASGASKILITPDGGQSGYYLGAHGSSMGNGVLTLNDVYGSGPIRVNGVKYPEDAYDAANKGYVDQITNAIQRGLSL